MSGFDRGCPAGSGSRSAFLGTFGRDLIGNSIAFIDQPDVIKKILSKITKTKIEIRTSKQIRMIKTHTLPNNLVLDFNILDLRVSVCFEFRASEFVFQLVGVLARKSLLKSFCCNHENYVWNRFNAEPALNHSIWGWL